MPGILSAGLTAVDNLCAGLIANGPAIIQSGINIILQLLNGLISCGTYNSDNRYSAGDHADTGTYRGNPGS